MSTENKAQIEGKDAAIGAAEITYDSKTIANAIVNADTDTDEDEAEDEDGEGEDVEIMCEKLVIAKAMIYNEILIGGILTEKDVEHIVNCALNK